MYLWVGSATNSSVVSTTLAVKSRRPTRKQRGLIGTEGSNLSRSASQSAPFCVLWGKLENSAVDLTRVLPEFLAAHKYCESIFENPQHLRAGSGLEVRAAALVNEACSREDANAGSVVAVTGLASLFDFLRVSSLIERVISGGCVVARR
jgi:hypothetical protein